MQTKWVIDDYILESRSVTGDLKKAIIDSGSELYESKYIPFAEEQDYGPYTEKDCVILYGTHGFIRKCKIPFTPGAYGYNGNTNCNVYYSNLPKEIMLNSEFIMLPFSYVDEDIFERFALNAFFIRPNSGYKTFAGKVLSTRNFHEEIKTSQQFSSVTPETICLISKVQKLHGEFRFVIGNREVIDGSEYRWDNVLDIRHDWPQECWDMADKVAKLPWQLDTIYTCDVALTDEGPKVIELNSFSMAGLYATDKNLIVNRVNEIAVKEFNGEL